MESLERTIQLAVERGKLIAYKELISLIADEMAKHPTTSSITLDNLLDGVSSLIKKAGN